MAAVFACGGTAVVAAGAVAGDRTVIKDRSVPAVGGVAVVTAIATGNVVGRLTLRHRTVVAAGAGANHSTVVNSADRAEAVSGVTILTVVAGVNMTAVFACGGTAVVATYTTHGDTRVIKLSVLPALGSMTIIATITAGDMSWAFTLCRVTVVT